MSAPPWVLSWCPKDSSGNPVTASINPCSPCMPNLPPSTLPPPGGYGLPAFETGAVNIQQVQYVWGPGQSGPNDPHALAQVVGQMKIETFREWSADFTSYHIVSETTGAFGTFDTVSSPYQFENRYISNLQITYPWYQNPNYTLPTIPVGGTSSATDNLAAQQSAVAQAYEVLGLSS